MLPHTQAGAVLHSGAAPCVVWCTVSPPFIKVSVTLRLVGCLWFTYFRCRVSNVVSPVLCGDPEEGRWWGGGGGQGLDSLVLVCWSVCVAWWFSRARAGHCEVVVVRSSHPSPPRGWGVHFQDLQVERGRATCRDPHVSARPATKRWGRQRVCRAPNTCCRPGRSPPIVTRLPSGSRMGRVWTAEDCRRRPSHDRQLGAADGRCAARTGGRQALVGSGVFIFFPPSTPQLSAVRGLSSHRSGAAAWDAQRSRAVAAHGRPAIPARGSSGAEPRREVRLRLTILAVPPHAGRKMDDPGSRSVARLVGHLGGPEDVHLSASGRPSRDRLTAPPSHTLHLQTYTHIKLTELTPVFLQVR